MSTGSDIYQTLGEHTGQLNSLAQTCDELRGTCTKINGKLDTLLADKHRAEGGRKMFYTIAGLAGSMAGAAGAAVVAWLKQ